MVWTAGGTAIDDPENWACYNSAGEKIVALPSKDTEVCVSGRRLPSIPRQSKFVCKLFTIDGWAVADEANVDLSGVKVVDLADNTRIITRNGHCIVVDALRAKRVRLDGSLSVMRAMRVSDDFEMKESSALRLPARAEMAYVESFSVKGDGVVALKPGLSVRRGSLLKLVRVGKMPKDMSCFRLGLSDEPADANFRPAAGGKFIGVMSRRGYRAE